MLLKSLNDAEEGQNLKERKHSNVCENVKIKIMKLFRKTTLLYAQ